MSEHHDTDNEELTGFALASHLIHEHRRMPGSVWNMRESGRWALHGELHATVAS